MRVYLRIGFVLLTLTLIALPGCRKATEDTTEFDDKPPEEVPFTLHVEPQSLQVPQGGKGKLKVSVTRRAYNGPISLDVENLPANLSTSVVTIPAGQKVAEIELTASPRAVHSERADTRVVGSPTEIQAKPMPSRDLHVSVQGAPFLLQSRPKLVKLPQGARAKVEVTVNRSGYDGPIIVELLNVPTQVLAPKATIPAGKDTVDLELAAAPAAPLGDTYDAQVQGTANVAANTFRTSSDTFMISVLPPLFTLRVEPALVKLTPRGKATVKLSAVRNGYDGPIMVELPKLPAGLTASKVQLTAPGETKEIELTADFQVPAGNRAMPVAGTSSAPGIPPSVTAFTLAIQPMLVLQPEPSAGLFMEQGSKAPVNVKLLRHGYDGPITLEFRQLPAGVTAPAVKVPASGNAGETELTVAPNAPVNPKGHVHVVALAPELGNVQLAAANLPLALFAEGGLPSGGFGLSVPLPQQVFKVAQGGTATLRVAITRKDDHGPIVLQLRNLPPHVTAPPLTLRGNPKAGDKSGDIVVLAAREAALGDTPGVTVVGSGRTSKAIPSKNFTLSVVPAPFELTAAPNHLRLAPGGEPVVLKVQAIRKDYQGPIVVDVQGLPPGVVAARTTVAPGQSEAQINVFATDAAPPGVSANTLLLGTATASPDELRVFSGPFTVEVLPGLYELTLEPPLVLLPQGGTVKVRASITRKGFEGAVPVQLLNLPPNVTASPGVIPKGADAVRLELKADLRAPVGDKVDVQAHSSASFKQALSPYVTVRVGNPRLALPFELNVEQKALDVKPGTPAPLKVLVIRNGYDGPVALEMRNLPVGVGAPMLTVPAGANSIEIPLTAQGNAVPGIKGDVCVLGTTVGRGAETQSVASPHVALTIGKK